MSQGQDNWPGDRMPKFPRGVATDADRAQMQSFVVPPSTTPISASQQTSSMSLPQYTAAPSTYGSTYSMPTPPSYPMNNMNWTGGMGLPDLLAPLNSTYPYHTQSNGTSTQQLNQWSPQQTATLPHFASIPSIAQNQLNGTNQQMMHPGMNFPMRAAGTSNGENASTPHANGPSYSRHSSISNTNNWESSKGKGPVPFKWRAGMKDQKITDDMTPEEKKEATEWNYNLAEAKKAHTREQNRISAQKSRQKKVVLLEKTKTQVEQLEDERTQQAQHIQLLNATVEQLVSNNVQLQIQIDILQNHLALLEEQLGVQRAPNSRTANTAPESQAQPLPPMQAQTGLPTPTSNNTPQAQEMLDFDLDTYIEPTNASPGSAQQTQQLGDLAYETQDEFEGVGWMNLSPDTPDWDSAPNGGSQ
ncbi:hypothetical protein F4804DRAFT_349418 [Jackrogersella minutella]|nr:hypothetical protein F4804DRAFT_349418 [Jackrogersella minutella]